MENQIEGRVSSETDVREKIYARFRQVMEIRLASFLDVDRGAFTHLAAALSLADLLDALFLTEGAHQTIGAHAGSIKTLIKLVGRDRTWRRPEPVPLSETIQWGLRS